MSDARRRITYGELWSEVQRFAEFLRRQGVQRGDVVTLQLPNRIEFPVVFFSLELIGAVANKISADFRARRGRLHPAVLEVAGVRLRQPVQGLRLPGDDPRAAADACPTCRSSSASTTSHAGDVVSFAKVVHDTPEIAEADRVHMSPLDVMRMCFTSGTTGNPKGVLHCFNTTLCTVRDVQTRARRHRARRDARLPAGRPQLGLHDARAGGHGRRARRADGALLRGSARSS